ncbi:hypothetical protein D9M72_465980 [compost metagenome]
MLRAFVNLVGGADLQDLAGGHHGDAVGKGQRFFLVVGDEDEGDAGFLLHPFQLHLHFLAQFQVERGERFVQQQHIRARRQGAGQGHPLLLAAGEFGGTAAGQVFHLHQGQHLLDPARDGVALQSLHLQAEGDILGHAHVREERIVLEHGIDPALVGRELVHALAADLDGAGGDLLEAGDGTQQGGLAAARRAKEGEELVVADADRDIVQRRSHFGIIGIALADALHLDGGCVLHDGAFLLFLYAKIECNLEILGLC